MHGPVGGSGSTVPIVPNPANGRAEYSYLVAVGSANRDGGREGMHKAQCRRAYHLVRAIDGTGDDLGEAQGWSDATTVRDIVKDPKTGYDDIIAFGGAGVYVSMGQDPATHNGQPFGQLYLALDNFGSDQGWTVAETPRLVPEIDGELAIVR